MAYATITNLRTYLDQVPADANADVLLQQVLDHASAVIDLELGHIWATATTTTALVFGGGTNYLPIPLPYVAGSVTGVTAPVGITVPAYLEQDGHLIARTSAGQLAPPSAAGIRGYGAAVGAWRYGVPYTIAAQFGYGPAPAALTEACLEIAADLYRFRDAGSIKAAGAADGGLVRGRALPDTARLILDRLKAGSKVVVR